MHDVNQPKAFRSVRFLSDDELLRQCRVDVTRGSGPGGQKRNKTSNAIRLTHLPTGIQVVAGESRSQAENKLVAMRRMRLKLATELTAGTRHERTLYVLDEPTTGLHVADVSRLVDVLGRLVERGDTLVVIEHHPQVMASADWLVELGPEGGEAGGRIVAEGPPRDVAKKKTATGVVLREFFGG